MVPDLLLDLSNNDSPDVGRVIAHPNSNRLKTEMRWGIADFCTRQCGFFTKAGRIVTLDLGPLRIVATVVVCYAIEKRNLT